MAVILQRTMVFFACLMAGFFLKKVGVLKKKHFRYVSFLVFYVTLPCAIINSFSNITFHWSFFGFILAGFVCDMILILTGFFLGKTKRQKALFMICLQGFNIGCFTIPYLQTMMNGDSVVAACLFDTGNAFLVNGGAFAFAYAVYTMAGEEKEAVQKVGIKDILKKVFTSVPLDVQLIMCIIMLLAIPLPQPILFFTGNIGKINGYVSMFMLGLGMEFAFSKEDIRNLCRMIGSRYFIGILLGIIVLVGFKQLGTLQKTVCLLLASPVSVSNSLFTARLFGAESREVTLSCTISSVTVIISVFIMTLVLIFI